MPEIYAQTHDWMNNWPVAWTPRSAAYRRGFQTGFRGLHREPTSLSCPFKAGTEAFDAYYAGLDDGTLHVKVQGDIQRESLR